MAKVIIYQGLQTIEVVRGTCPKLKNETEDLYLKRVAETMYPGRPYIISELKHGWNKNKPLDAFDPEFRGTWTLNKNKEISINMEKAKTIWLNKIRKYRNEALKRLDIEWMTAISKGHLTDAQDIEEIKQILRNLPSTVSKKDFSTLEELKAYWPTILSPAPALSS